MVQDYRQPGDVVEIEGKPFKRMPNDLRYRYDADKVKCPVCGNLGTPWQGWYSCESGDHVALVDTGEVFVRQSTINT